MSRTPDTMTVEGAQRLAARIAAYWHERGALNVRTRIEKGWSKGVFFQAVRSNLINGLPPETAQRRLSLR